MGHPNLLPLHSIQNIKLEYAHSYKPHAEEYENTNPHLSFHLRIFTQIYPAHANARHIIRLPGVGALDEPKLIEIQSIRQSKARGSRKFRT